MTTVLGKIGVVNGIGIGAVIEIGINQAIADGEVMLKWTKNSCPQIPFNVMLVVGW